jgi:hypothetical protein
VPLETYVDQLEPENQDAVIWRFMKWEKFRDLMTTGELYFCRADLFTNDLREGLPPEEYLPAFGLHPLDVLDRQQLSHHIGSDAQFREGFYVSCWHLFRDETCNMWKQYGEDGVAICSHYRLLKTALNAMDDRAYLGLVRYGAQHVPSWDRANLFRYITTKRMEYAAEREARAFLWISDPLAGINRHIDSDNRIYPLPLTPPPDRVSKGERRKIDLQALVTEIVVTPWASSITIDEINVLVKNNGYTVPVRPSELTRYRELLPYSPTAVHP